jgi:DNA-binding LacI/PurR family transcriptional regulator
MIEEIAGNVARSKTKAVEEIIRKKILDGSFPPGSKLPSDYDLARQYEVAYMTVRAAIAPLVNEGRLLRRRGKGTFVPSLQQLPAQTPTVALMVPSLSMLWNVAGLYYFPQIFQGFCAKATQLGYEPTIIGHSQQLANGPSDEQAPTRLDRFSGVACMLIERSDESSVDTLCDLRVPTVTINPYHGRRALPSVIADQDEGVCQAVNHLISLGHKRIAFLGGPKGNLGAEQRARGFREVMAHVNLPILYTERNSGDYTDQNGAARALVLLRKLKRPTAIVAAGDLIAAGVLRAAAEIGISVPKDLSVVGFGDFHVAGLLRPALTTVRIPLEELGANAVTILQAFQTSHKHIASIHLETKLVLRDTTAIAPNPSPH